MPVTTVTDWVPHPGGALVVPGPSVKKHFEDWRDTVIRRRELDLLWHKIVQMPWTGNDINLNEWFSLNPAADRVEHIKRRLGRRRLRERGEMMEELTDELDNRFLAEVFSLMPDFVLKKLARKALGIDDLLQALGFEDNAGRMPIFLPEIEAAWKALPKDSYAALNAAGRNRYNQDYVLGLAYNIDSGGPANAAGILTRLSFPRQQQVAASPDGIAGAIDGQSLFLWRTRRAGYRLRVAEWNMLPLAAFDHDGLPFHISQPTNEIPGPIGAPGPYEFDLSADSRFPLGYGQIGEDDYIIFLRQGSGAGEIDTVHRFQSMARSNQSTIEALKSDVNIKDFREMQVLHTVVSSGDDQYVLSKDDGLVITWSAYDRATLYDGAKAIANAEVRKAAGKNAAMTDSKVIICDMAPLTEEDAGIRDWVKRTSGLRKARYRTSGAGGTKGPIFPQLDPDMLPVGYNPLTDLHMHVAKGPWFEFIHDAEMGEVITKAPRERNDRDPMRLARKYLGIEADELGGAGGLPPGIRAPRAIGGGGPAALDGP